MDDVHGLRDVTIVSGGQTGADRAALDFAMEHNLRHGGWCPRGRLAEDGPIDAKYQLRSTPSPQYAQRTEWNIRDSDATVVFVIERELTGGTALTAKLAGELARPLLVLARDSVEGGATATGTRNFARELCSFLSSHRVVTLNVAGPRASQVPHIGSFVWAVLTAAIALPDPPVAARCHEKD